MRANFHTDRRGVSRSPARHNMYHDSRDRSSQGRRIRDEGEVYDSDQGASRRPPRGRSWGNDDYSRMYEDGQPSDEHDSRGSYHSRERYQGDRRRHRDYDDPNTRSPSRRHRSRSRSQSPGRDAGRPSDTIILEGLPFDVPPDDLQDSILNYSPIADFKNVDVRISSRGNRRAFVQFASVDDAIALMQDNFPKLPIDMPYPTDTAPDRRFRAYMHYARNRDEGESQNLNANNWSCRTCDYSNYPTRSRCKVCGAPPSDDTNWKENLTGATDAGDKPSQILVVYPIPSFVTETMLANDMKRLEVEKPVPVKDSGNGAPKLKSTAPTGNAAGYGARPGSLHRIFLMREISSDDSFKYGFAEFWTLEDASAAMTKFNMLKSFTIAACQATVSTIHMGVFLPEERHVTPEIERTSFHPLLNPALRVRYWDTHLYPSQLVVAPEPPGGKTDAKSAGDAANDSKKTKKRKAEGPLGASATKKSVPMIGQMAMWQRKHDEIHGPKDSAQENETPAGDVNQTPIGPSASRRAAKSDQNAPIKFNLTASSGLAASRPSDQSNSPEKSGESPAANDGEPGDGESAPKKDPVSYVDRDKLMCLICMRKYKSVDEVNIHERSKNHKTATENPDLVKAALPRLAKLQQRSSTQNVSDPASTTAGPQYRDRAKERREAYNQPKKPSGQAAAGSNGASKPKPTPAKEEKAPPKPPQQSKGAGMLAKMGWTSGAGLGANGEGRTEVIATNAYQEGVGLGAEGSNLGDAAQLAERKTKNDYSDYLSSVQDKARERYSKMG